MAAILPNVSSLLSEGSVSERRRTINWVVKKKKKEEDGGDETRWRYVCGEMMEYLMLEPTDDNAACTLMVGNHALAVSKMAHDCVVAATALTHDATLSPRNDLSTTRHTTHTTHTTQHTQRTLALGVQVLFVFCLLVVIVFVGVVARVVARTAVAIRSRQHGELLLEPPQLGPATADVAAHVVHMATRPEDHRGGQRVEIDSDELVEAAFLDVPHMSSSPLVVVDVLLNVMVMLDFVMGIGDR
jgi:hypothetical protein